MTAVVILAGGEGRRIGGDKPGRLLGGERLLDRALAQARGWSSLVAISSSNAQPFADEPGIASLADASDRGPIAGIAAALKFARTSGVGHVMTISCDTPFLPPDLPDRLHRALTASTAAAMASSGGRLHPTCALWRVTTIDDLAAYLATGRASLHGFAESIGAVAVEWPIDPVDPFFNINAASDLAAAEALLKSR